jgi:hypothetical protein
LFSKLHKESNLRNELRVTVGNLRGSQLLLFLVSISLFVSFSPASYSQDSNVVAPRRLSAVIDESKQVVLRGNTHPLANPANDIGPAATNTAADHVFLLLKRSSSQQQALDELVRAQGDSTSDFYRKYLTPEQFGQQFGPSDEDIAVIKSWLERHKFTVEQVMAGKMVIEFSGTIGDIQSAFHVFMRNYTVSGRQYLANEADPQIPASLEPVVGGVLSLNNFPTKHMSVILGPVSQSEDSGKVTPLFNVNTVNSSAMEFHGVSPYDFATIYNVLPLWNASPAIDGTGQTIAIAGRSDIDLEDVRAFRRAYGLPAKDPAVIWGGDDPGRVAGDEQIENTLDVEWSGAVAKNAQINFVVAKAGLTPGEAIASQYILDHQLGQIMSFSYGACEQALWGVSNVQYYSNLWEQAVGEGIAIFVAAGDNGSAGCDTHNGKTPSPATGGLAVTGEASTPWNVAVGGTDFNDNGSWSSYWNSTKNANGSSAKGYIPEVPWNASCAPGGEAACNNSANVSQVMTVGGSGGKSSCRNLILGVCVGGGFAKPYWQSGYGVPQDGVRDLPDVSLFSSSGTNGSFYLIYEGGQTFAVGGTSVASPAMAGIMALANQAAHSTTGNPNIVFYSLARNQGAKQCDTKNAAKDCVFYDMTTGTNSMPCKKGSANCTTSNSSDKYGLLTGYDAGYQYDLATGLGSVNAYNLVAAWPGSTVGKSSFTISTNTTSQTVKQGQNAVFTLTVKSNNGFHAAVTPAALNLPTGYVASGTGWNPPTITPPANGTASSTLTVATNTGTTPNTYTVTLRGSATGYTTQTVPVTIVVNSAAAKLPTVTTGSASSVTASSATLGGTVNPNGADTHFWFLYGTSSSLSGASQTPSQDLGSGTSAAGISANIAQLVGGTKYYFQVVAQNSAGTTKGAINYFTTSTTAKLPTVTTGSAGGITTSTATLYGTVNPNGFDTHAWFLIATNSSMSGAVQGASSDVGSGTLTMQLQSSVSGMTAGATYYFQLVAQNSAGTVKGGVSYFTTNSPSNPPTVTTGSAGGITTSSATLYGTVNPNGSDTHAWFLIATNSSMSGAVQGASADVGSGTSIMQLQSSVSGMTAGATYYFQMVAQNSAGTVKGGVSYFTTNRPSNPPTVTTGSAGSITSSTATIYGTVNPNGSDTHFWFLIATNSSMSGAAQGTSADAGSGTSNVQVSSSVTGMSGGVTYYYQLVAQNSAGTVKGGINYFTAASAGRLPTVTTGSAGGITSSTATIYGTVNANGSDTHAWFLIAGNSSMSGAIQSNSVDVGSSNTTYQIQCGLTGASAGATYYFQMVAQNSYGTVKGAVNHFTTISQSSRPAVTSGAVSDIKVNSVAIAGTVKLSADNVHVNKVTGAVVSLSAPIRTASQGLESGRSTNSLEVTPVVIVPVPGNRPKQPGRLKKQ